MAGLSDAFGEAAKRKLFEAGLSKGDIFLNKFDGIDHEKFFIVAGVSGDKIFTCSIYINSEIHPSLLRKPELVMMQIPLLKKIMVFLSMTHTRAVPLHYILILKKFIDGKTRARVE